MDTEVPHFRRILQITLLTISLACVHPAFAGQALIDFEAYPTSYGSIGVDFTQNGIWSGTADNVEDVPSPTHYLGLYPASPMNCNVTNGFTAISIYYINGHTDAGTLRVYSGLDGSGTLLTSVSLPRTPVIGGTFTSWVQKSL